MLKTTIGQWFFRLQAPVQWGLWTKPILEPKPFGTPINQPGLSEGTGVSVDTHLVAQDTTMEWMTCSCDIPTSYRRGVQFPGDTPQSHSCWSMVCWVLIGTPNASIPTDLRIVCLLQWQDLQGGFINVSPLTSNLTATCCTSHHCHWIQVITSEAPVLLRATWQERRGTCGDGRHRTWC